MIEIYKQIQSRLSEIVLAGVAVPCDIGQPTKNRNPPYMFVWGSVPVHESLTAAGCDVNVDEHLKVTFVHTSSWNALQLGEQVRSLLDGWTPQVPGWRVFPIHVDTALPVTPDTTVINGPSNTYPPYGVLEAHVQATKE